MASNIVNMTAQGAAAVRERQEIARELEGARVAVAANASVVADLEVQVRDGSLGYLRSPADNNRSNTHMQNICHISQCVCFK